jgi:hypothetical protein
MRESENIFYKKCYTKGKCTLFLSHEDAPVIFMFCILFRILEPVFFFCALHNLGTVIKLCSFFFHKSLLTAQW